MLCFVSCPPTHNHIKLLFSKLPPHESKCTSFRNHLVRNPIILRIVPVWLFVHRADLSLGAPNFSDSNVGCHKAATTDSGLITKATSRHSNRVTRQGCVSHTCTYALKHASYARPCLLRVRACTHASLFVAQALVARALIVGSHAEICVCMYVSPPSGNVHVLNQLRLRGACVIFQQDLQCVC